MVVALLYAMQSPCNCFTLSLSGSDSRKSNKLARRQRYYDGDHDGSLETEIKGTR